MIGAIAGAMPKIIDTWLISRCASSPDSTSRITARPTIMPTPALSPCSARNTSSVGRSVASAQPTDASAKTASPARITRRRPTASDSGPCTTLINAYATRYTLIVCCIATLSAPSCAPIAGNAGNTVSIENGPNIASPPSNRASQR
jgi:hypothetical protein